jgi:hypothetical protein
MAAANAALAFLFELTVYVAAGWWGYRRSPRRPVAILSAVAAITVMAAVWATFGAPRAVYPLRGAARLLLDICWYGVAALALLRLRRPRAAALFTALCLLYGALTYS